MNKSYFAVERIVDGMVELLYALSVLRTRESPEWDEALRKLELVLGWMQRRAKEESGSYVGADET